MIKDIFEKFGGRFKNHLPTTYNSSRFMPSYTIKDTFDGEIFTIKIDSLTADPEFIIEQLLNNKITSKRNDKINKLIN